MAVLHIDGSPVYYEVRGKGLPVLFLHGWMGSWRYWKPTMDVVVGAGYRVYSFDFWGFGHSDKDLSRISIDDYVDQVIRFLDELGIDRVILVGHSMGGMVSLKTAVEHADRVRRVVAAAPPIDGQSLAPLYKLTGKEWITHLFVRPPVVSGIWAFLMWRIRQGWRRWFREVVEEGSKAPPEVILRSVRSLMATDLRPILPYLTVPALVVYGDQDDVVDPDQARVVEEVGNPQIQVRVLPECRHFPFLDDPPAFHALLLPFLEEERQAALTGAREGRRIPFSLRRSRRR